MQSLSQEYLELIAQFQNYLAQEYAPRSWLEVNRESYWHFRRWIQDAGAKIPHPEIKTAQKSEVLAQAPKNLPPIINKNPVVDVANEIKTVKSPEPTEKLKKVDEKIAVSIEQQASAIEKQDFSDIRKMVLERMPEQVLLDNPLDDSLAKSIKNAWKTNPKQASFVTNLCKAIKVIFGLNAQVNGSRLLWGDEKKYEIELGDLEAYARDPQLKARLWKSIQEQNHDVPICIRSP